MDEKKIANILYRHAVGSDKYSIGDANAIVRLLNSADEDLVQQIAARYALILSKGYDRGPATTSRLNDLLEAIREINTEVYGKIAAEMPVRLQALAAHEFEFTAAAMKAGGAVDFSTTLPSASYLKTLVNTSPIDGRLYPKWVSDMDAVRFGKLEQAIRIGALQGEATDSLVARIRGTKAAKFTDGILNISRHDAQTFVITANSTIQNTARLETFKAMKSVRYLEFSAILDTRTSSQCRSLSGNIYEIDDPKRPMIPVHRRCRSLYLPRKDNTGDPLHTPYDVWIKGQSSAVQDSVLGKRKAQALRDGKLTHNDLYRTDGSMKSLAELKAHDASLFDD